MAQQLSDLFALEAGEYLDQLDALIARGSAPDAARLLRLARGVRGSAQLAQAGAVAGVAERLERAAYALMQGRLQWSDGLHALVARTAADLRALVGGFRAWGAEHEARADEAVRAWAAVLPAPGDAGGARPDADERLIPFVRNEIAGIRIELGRALTEWSGPHAPVDALRRVQLRMRAVRGIQGAAPLRPLLGMLEAVDDVIRAVAQRNEAAALGREALAAAAGVLNRAAGEAEGGRFPELAGPDWQRFQQLSADLEPAAGAQAEDDAVAVHTLFFDGAGPHIVESPVAPLPGAAGGEVPAAVRDFLQLEATGLLERAQALLAEAHGPARAATAPIVELARAVHDLAATYGVEPLRAAADRAMREVGAAATLDAAREALERLRPVLGADVAAVEHGDVVAVESLLLRGDRALEEALALQPRLEAAVDTADAYALRGVADELFALIRLGRERGA